MAIAVLGYGKVSSAETRTAATRQLVQTVSSHTWQSQFRGGHEHPKTLQQPAIRISSTLRRKKLQRQNKANGAEPNGRSGARAMNDANSMTFACPIFDVLDFVTASPWFLYHPLCCRKISSAEVMESMDDLSSCGAVLKISKESFRNGNLSIG